MIDSLSEMTQNLDKKWNRDTIGQASSLLKSLDFEFIINLVITQKVLAYTSGIIKALQLNSGSSDEQLTEDYFRINVTIPLLDDVLESLQI